MTHYDTLEVSSKASQETIRAAYKSLMQRYHPDRNPNDAAVAELAMKITNAYNILSDPDLRSAYDRDLAQLSTQPLSSGGPDRAPHAYDVKDSNNKSWPKMIIWALSAIAAMVILLLLV